MAAATPSWSRREILRVGALSVLSPLSPALGAGDGTPGKDRSARACIFILLQGGPSHLDLWDPKPDAPAEVRGPFATIETATTGVRFGELVPRTAGIADQLAIVRSVEHNFNNHIAGTYITLTGSSNQPNQDREAAGGDEPGPGAVLNYLQRGPIRIPPSVSLPNWLSIPGPSNRMPGQYGGYLGSTNDPFLVSGDPHKPDFKPLALSLPEGVNIGRVAARRHLLAKLDDAALKLETQLTQSHSRLHNAAFELVIDPRFRDAMDLSLEPQASRERYGNTKLGQSLLLARRLIESGVRLVSYNAFNQAWDTHGGLDGRYRKIVPPMDQAFATLVQDLRQRGLLDHTLVINTGEFGRTPTVNNQAGRDHWPHAYTTLLAGGGVRGGQVHGASDAKGAHVADKPVAPADLLATMWHQLGIDPNMTIHDNLARPHALSRGRVLHELL